MSIIINEFFSDLEKEIVENYIGYIKGYGWCKLSLDAFPYSTFATNQEQEDEAHYLDEMVSSINWMTFDGKNSGSINDEHLYWTHDEAEAAEHELHASKFIGVAAGDVADWIASRFSEAALIVNKLGYLVLKAK